LTYIRAADVDRELEVYSDVTIVGAGPAGIATALELGRAGLAVCLIESGKLRRDSTVQELGELHSFDSARHAPMNLCTSRQIGGATAIWGGRCVPYDPVDFDSRDYIPDSQWPVRYDHLTSYFQRASDYFFTGDAKFDTNDIDWISAKTIVPDLRDDELRTSTLERWSLPTDFGKEYRDELRRLPNVRVFLLATCTKIETNAGGTEVVSVNVKSPNGTPIVFRAKQFVIACGGLETTRLLLASNDRVSAGLGNRSGLLGRYYMGHISGKISKIRFSGSPQRTIFGCQRDHDGVYVRQRFTFTRQFLHENKLPNFAAWLANPQIGDPCHGNGVLSFAYLALASPLGKHFVSEAIRQAAISHAPNHALAGHIRNIVRQPLATLKFIPTFGYKRYLVRRRVPGFYQRSSANEYDLHYHGEQVPNPNSRVTLSNERDALGMPKLDVDFCFSSQDVDGVLRSHQYIDSFLRRNSAGHLTYQSANLEQSVWDQATDGYHQAGTTRMSTNPEQGVVDENCKVHGLGNLYVASSSVFVTSGQANSTFMMLVFALRLSDHIRQRTKKLETLSSVKAQR
jgi:choline dehydrogenase-like flavoprotein